MFGAEGAAFFCGGEAHVFFCVRLNLDPLWPTRRGGGV